METKELKQLEKFAKRIVETKILKKVRKVKDSKDRLEVLRHTIKSALDSRVHELDNAVQKLKKEGEYVFIEEVKISTIRMKMKMFNVTFEKKDFNNILRLYKDINRELKNV
jgi:hypothetical protein